MNLCCKLIGAPTCCTTELPTINTMLCSMVDSFMSLLVFLRNEEIDSVVKGPSLYCIWELGNVNHEPVSVVPPFSPSLLELGQYVNVT